MAKKRHKVKMFFVHFNKQGYKDVESVTIKLPKKVAVYLRKEFKHGQRSRFFIECLEAYKNGEDLILHETLPIKKPVMKEKPIIKKMEKFVKKIPSCEWHGNEDVPVEFRDFQEGIKTSSDNFWYSLNNRYIDVSLITDDNLEDLTKKDLDRMQIIIGQFGYEF